MDVDINPNITCAVCGENDFHLKEGFYYCNECGTKSEQVRALELENDEEFVDTKGRKTQKIKAEKSDKLEPTSWECYNYILRGIVEELIDMGAKEELKVMVLQVWAAYLRTLEVAFFSRRHAELPKLGVRYEPRDATILYNHIKEKKKKKKDNDNVSVASSAKKQWRKHMKNLDQSQYEASMSIYSQSSLGETSFNSSGSAASNRAIRLNFSNKARKRFKKKMPSAHLKKHEHDFNNALKCHKIRVKHRDLRYPELNMELNMKQLYAIVIIALNLIEDDIQLTDFMRFVLEEHISTRNVERFFPENLSMNCKGALTAIRFHMKLVFFPVTSMREHCGNLCKALHITTVKLPDILKLIQRYILELCLPSEIYTFIERLINLYPPKMEWNKATAIPSYESRAMAYIIFTLKLLFGLDGRKEKQISRSARRVNFQLTEMGLTSQGDLFVWDDWVEYIEMRKVILCTHSLFFCKQFKQTPTREMYLHKLSEEWINPTEKDLSKNQMKKTENMEIVFKNYLVNKNDNGSNEAGAQTRFTPSFTPCLNYFKRIQLDPSIKETIPDFMYVDYTKCTLAPFLRPADLQILFSKYGKKLDVVRVECTSKLKHVGTFSNPVLKKGQTHSRCIRFNDNQDAWEEKINKNRHRNTTFRYPMEKYSDFSLRIMRKRVLHRQGVAVPINTSTALPKLEITCNRSIDLFSEDNMEPSQLSLLAPRRFLERVNLFEKLNDDEDFKLEQSLNASLPLDAETTIFKISNMDCWTIMGKSFELTEAQANEVKSKMPVTFFWLLETCANTLGVSWLELYDQLMVLEIFFGYTIEPLNNFEDRIIFKEESKIKDINKLIRYFKTYW